MVVKLEPAAGVFRDTERNYRAFEREALFYKDVAGGVDVRVPRVYHAHAGEDGSVLVMEDLTRLTSGDQVRGMLHHEVIATVREIGRVHAAYWNNHGSPRSRGCRTTICFGSRATKSIGPVCQRI